MPRVVPVHRRATLPTPALFGVPKGTLRVPVHKPLPLYGGFVHFARGDMQ